MTPESEIKKCKAIMENLNPKSFNYSVLKIYIHSLQGGSVSNNEREVSEEKSSITSFSRPEDNNFIEKLREKDLFSGEIKSNGGKNGGTRT